MKTYRDRKDRVLLEVRHASIVRHAVLAFIDVQISR
jgi:hypothetical protein